MTRLIALAILAALAAGAAERQVVIVGIDGLRAAALEEQSLPNISALRKRGASTLGARAVMPSVSSPNWASMIMGAGPEAHGITSNEWKPGPGGMFPSIFDTLRGERPDAVIACFHDWDGFKRLVEHVKLDALARGNGPVETMEKAIAFLKTRRPALLFIQLDHVDHAGHEKGYTSPEYAAAVREADRLIGELAPLIPDAVLLVTSDHGGLGTKHGGDSAAELDIPWIIAGPGIAEGKAITAPVSTVDTAATVAAILGVKPPARWTGRPIEEAFIAEPPKAERRADLNLLGATNTEAGESRRNENMQFNLLDNNALKELNIRMGITPTITAPFEASGNYYGTEYGNAPPMPPHLAARKTAAVHGAVFALHNNSVFSARSFFQVGAVQPARENQAGFTLSAPLWKGAAVTLDASLQPIRGVVNGNVLVPRADERTPLATDPAVRAMVQRFLDAYPRLAPNRTDMSERALNMNAPQHVDTSNALARFDQQLGARDRLGAHFAMTGQHVDAFQFVAGQNPDTDTKSRASRLTWDRTWSPATITSFTFAFDRVHSLLTAEPNAVGPTVVFGSAIQSLGPGSTIPIDRVQNIFRYAVQLKRSLARHTWTAGFEIGRRQFTGSETNSHRGHISFRSEFGRDALTNLRLGTPSRYSTGIGERYAAFRRWEPYFYIGDEWRPSARLTLSLGLRYQPVTAPRELAGRAQFDFGCDCRNFSPRAGAAWRLPGAWGALRAAYSLQYGDIYPAAFQQLRFNPPNTYKIEVQTPSLLAPLGNLDPVTLGPETRTTFFVLSPNLATPRVHLYNAAWEFTLAANWRAQLAYVGSRSDHLLLALRNNRARIVAGIPQTTATINQRRPDPRHYEVRDVTSLSAGAFDAGRVSLNSPSWRGLTIVASYWMSKAIDSGAPYSSTGIEDDPYQALMQTEFDVVKDLRAVSDFDQSHALLARVAYAAPRFTAYPRWLRSIAGGWEFSGILLAKTGTPFTVYTGSDSPGFGNVDGGQGDRPNLVNPAILGRTVNDPDTSAALLPANAFAFIQPTDPRGNLGRNTFRKDGISNVNAAATKAWTLRRELALSLRLESINLLNTPQFAAPGSELASSDFARITNTLNDGRTFRFLLRLRF